MRPLARRRRQRRRVARRRPGRRPLQLGVPQVAVALEHAQRGPARICLDRRGADAVLEHVGDARVPHGVMADPAQPVRPEDGISKGWTTNHFEGEYMKDGESSRPQGREARGLLVAMRGHPRETGAAGYASGLRRHRTWSLGPLRWRETSRVPLTGVATGIVMTEQAANLNWTNEGVAGGESALGNFTWSYANGKLSVVPDSGAQLQ